MPCASAFFEAEKNNILCPKVFGEERFCVQPPAAQLLESLRV